MTLGEIPSADPTSGDDPKSHCLCVTRVRRRSSALRVSTLLALKPHTAPFVKKRAHAAWGEGNICLNLGKKSGLNYAG